MAPAVTSDKSPCPIVSHLRTETVPTLPVNTDTAILLHEPRSFITVESAMSNSADNRVVSENGTIVPEMSSVLSSASHVALSPVTSGSSSKPDAEGQVGSCGLISEPVNGIPAPSTANMVASRIVSLTDGQQRTLNILIKNNNGKCAAGVLQKTPIGETKSMASATCNGGGNIFIGSSNSTSTASTLHLTRQLPHGAPLPLHRMVIIPRLNTIQSSATSGKVGVEEKKPDRTDVKSVTTALDDSSVEVVVPPTDVSIPLASAENVNNASARQRAIEKRILRLLLRLRRLQTRETNSFVKQQLGGLVSFLRRPNDSSKVIDGAGDGRVLNSMSDYRNMSTSQLVGLVQRMQSSEMLQSQQSLEESASDIGILDSAMCAKLSSTAGRLASNLRHLEQAVDSDATESSSGSESESDEPSCKQTFNECDWMSSTTNSADRTQASLAWSSERAMIASRWTWLQAQVSDLEYRIRQQSDIYRQLRQLKGVAVSYRSSTLDTTSSSASLPKSSTDNGNGVADVSLDNGSNSKSGSSSSSDIEKSSTSVVDVTCRAARCSAVRTCRKRRLLRSATAVLQATSQRKPTALSTVRCTACYPPAMPCALCAGRFNHTVVVGPHQSLLERNALLDPAFHPVLSFPQDVLLSTRLAECMRHGVVVNTAASHAGDSCQTKSKGLTVRISKAHLKSLAMPSYDPDDESDSTYLPPHVQQSFYRNSRSLSASDEGSNVMFSTTKASRRAFDTMRRKKRIGLASKRLGRSATSACLKPVGRPPRLSQSASSASFKEALRRQSSSCTSRPIFDINNVIIPYCASASAPRLEILQYKEIDTPKWRELRADEIPESRRRSASSKPASSKRPRCDSARHSMSAADVLSAKTAIEQMQSLDPAAVRSISLEAVNNMETEHDTDSEVEDMSDEAFSFRHLRYEIYEKKQFFPSSGQPRRSRSNRSESDQSTLPHPRSPEPTPTVDFACEPAAGTSSHYLESYFHPQESMSPTATTFDGHIRRNSSSSSVAPRTMSFSFDPLVMSRYAAEPTNAAEVVAAETRSWPPRSFPLDDSDFEQLQDNRSSVTRNSSGRTTSVSGRFPCATHIPVTSTPIDPGWTVTTRAVNDEGKDFAPPTFVLKIAKV